MAVGEPVAGSPPLQAKLDEGAIDNAVSRNCAAWKIQCFQVKGVVSNHDYRRVEAIQPNASRILGSRVGPTCYAIWWIARLGR